MGKYEAYAWVFVVGAVAYLVNRYLKRRQTRKKYLESRTPCPGCGELLGPKARVCGECGYRYTKSLRIRVWADKPDKAVEQIKAVIPNARFRDLDALRKEGLQFDVPTQQLAEELRIGLLEQGIRVRVEEYYK